MLDTNNSIAVNSVDYSKLQELLEAGNWAAADNKTLAILLKLAGLENEDKLDVEHIEKISSSDLKAIDQLWVNCSNGHFGFSVQKSLYGQDISYLYSQVEWIRVEPEYSASQERLSTSNSQGRFYIRISYENAKQKGHLPACILSSALRHNPLVYGYCSWGHPMLGGKRRDAEFYINRWCETNLEVLKHIYSLL